MQTGEFVAAFREAFGPVPELPLLFRYTDEPLRPAAKAGGCFFKALAEARDGRPVGLNASNIGCGGGKFYTGFSPMPEFVPQFVSLKERYKQTPEMVLDFIAALDLAAGAEGVARVRACGCGGDVRRGGRRAILRYARRLGGARDMGRVRQRRPGCRCGAVRLGMQYRGVAGRAGKP